MSNNNSMNITNEIVKTRILDMNISKVERDKQNSEIENFTGDIQKEIENIVQPIKKYNSGGLMSRGN